VKNLKTTWLLVGDGLQLGASIVFAIFIGAGLGYWLDGTFNTFPYLSIVFSFLALQQPAATSGLKFGNNFAPTR